MSQRAVRPILRDHGDNPIDQIDLLVEIARAYYEQNHNQDKIAQSLGISRSQVSRYLAKARKLNLVQVRIVAPGERAASLERALKRRFKSLKDAVVAAAFNLQPEPLRKTIGPRLCRLPFAKNPPGHAGVFGFRPNVIRSHQRHPSTPRARRVHRPGHGQCRP